MKSFGVFSCFNLCLLQVICFSGENDSQATYADADEMTNDAAVNDANNVNGAINDNIQVKDDLQDKNEAVDDQNQNDVSVSDEPVDAESVADAQDGSPGGSEELIDTNVQDDKIADQNNILPSDQNDSSVVTLDKTFVDPVIKLTAAQIEKLKLWPKALVPYFIDELSYDKVLRDKIRGYLDSAQRRTNVNFYELMEPPTDENERWVFFVNRRGQLDCKDYSHKSFTNKGVQKVVVGYDCLKHGGPMAAIVLALLGVPPQHNAPNRDEHIIVYNEHIIPEKRGLFKRLTKEDWLFENLEYDYNSISHYPAHKYTMDGHETIRVKTPCTTPCRAPDILTGDRTDFTNYDLYKITLLYKDLASNRTAKGLKLEDCKAFYRPGHNLKYNQLLNLPEGPKPKLHDAESKKLYASIDHEGEPLSDLEAPHYT